ncbi:cGMP-dependent protein kinase [Fasciolopsis buskii]|uniref:cGMP-dependent protein kinase n=1 Tax=Fasciolopsis buskii TaxID=27845 RepID=A0A8E0VMI5_9TREM|nr:cGMP-dependent protein kinase [Fasciolopsis buski]
MEVELKRVIEEQKEEINKLKEQLAASQIRIADLTSAVDKYQSVFSRQTNKLDLFSDGLGGNANKQQTLQTRKRAIGISAEPEDAEQIVLHELKRHPKPDE